MPPPRGAARLAKETDIFDSPTNTKKLGEVADKTFVEGIREGALTVRAKVLSLPQADAERAGLRLCSAVQRTSSCLCRTGRSLAVAWDENLRMLRHAEPRHLSWPTRLTSGAPFACMGSWEICEMQDRRLVVRPSSVWEAGR